MSFCYDFKNKAVDWLYAFTGFNNEICSAQMIFRVVVFLIDTDSTAAGYNVETFRKEPAQRKVIWFIFMSLGFANETQMDPALAERMNIRCIFQPYKGFIHGTFEIKAVGL